MPPVNCQCPGCGKCFKPKFRYPPGITPPSCCNPKARNQATDLAYRALCHDCDIGWNEKSEEEKAYVPELSPEEEGNFEVLNKLTYYKGEWWKDNEIIPTRSTTGTPPAKAISPAPSPTTTPPPGPWWPPQPVPPPPEWPPLGHPSPTPPGLEEHMRTQNLWSQPVISSFNAMRDEIEDDRRKAIQEREELKAGLRNVRIELENVKEEGLAELKKVQANLDELKDGMGKLQKAVIELSGFIKEKAK